MSDEIEDILGEGGLLSEALERYEYRPQQIEMARAVGDAISQRRPLIVEAATGTGKTLAYLIPGLLSGKRVIVSTGTKALQEQLFHKDIPFLAEHWPEDFEAILLKGRKNYLCKLRFEEMKLNPSFRSREEAQMWPRILSWANETETGDRAEIPGLPDDFATWNDLSVGGEACLGTQCKHYETCHITKARRDAQRADVIVVNHHLFFADLAIREGGYGEILPEFDALVFDEAHHIESVATSYFGIQVSNWRIRELTGDIERAMETEDVTDDDVDEALKVLGKASDTFFSNLSFGLYDGRYELEGVLDENGGLIGDSLSDFQDALKDLGRRVLRITGMDEVKERLAERCREIAFELDFLTEAEDPKYVYFLELRDKGRFLQAAPIDLARLLRKRLLDVQDTIIFTSATLATGGNFDFFKQRLGMTATEDGEIGDDYAVDELLLPAVFDYEAQCLVYVPNRLPEPKDPEFTDNVGIIVDYLLGITEGRAFVLFTSYGNLNAVYDDIADDIPYPVLKQGEKPKKELLEEFRAETHSVLFATSSFWEGVDVEGEALSLVVIDKLPFANPSDPLVRARTELLEARGKNPFMEYSVPSAALSLKQGFGRLIRSRSDIGVVAILDSRIVHKFYGKYFLESLPPAPVVWRAAEVKKWWAEHGR